jgi:hypothetical protein
MTDAAEKTQYSQEAERAFAGAEPEPDLSGLGSKFLAEFARAEIDRRPTEERWLQDLRQYKGKYDQDEEIAIGNTRSKSYVRKTRVKVKTVDSRVADLLFPAGNDKNWTIDPTPVPSVPDAMRKGIIQQMMQAAQQAQQAQAQQQAQQAQQQGQGAPQDPSQPPAQPPAPQQPPAPIPQPSKEQVDTAVMEMVKKAAKGMSKVIDDQLTESRYKKHAVAVLHSGNLYGTGVLKGPLVERRIRVKFVMKGSDWVPTNEAYLIPFVDYVPVWRWYPDMSVTELEQCRFAYERHTLSPSQLYDLTRNKSFDGTAIKAHIEANPDGLVTHRYYDNEIKFIGARQSKQGDIGGQYEVLERWGYIDGRTLRGLGVEVEDARLQESFFSNVWVLPNGVVIKAVLQPINGVTWPYHIYYFDKDETSIFGEGLASIMRDDQKMLNAATRMMLDNGAITSGPMIEVDVSMLASSDTPTEVAPWKVVLTNGKKPGQTAIKPVVIPNNLEWLQMMAKQFDTNADEVTAIPRYMTGENASSGAAGTSSGLSMLMGAVNIVIKDLITGYDEGVTTPFLQSLYRWNMQFNKSTDIKGDFDVAARGTASLVAKEVRARQLNEFAQLTADPLDAPFVKRHRLNQLRAEALEMSDVIMTEDEVAADAAGKQAGQQAQQQLQMQMQQAQLGEQQAKAAKLMADTEVSKAKVQEMLKKLEQMAADMLLTQAEVERTNAETISKKVEAVFAALQAGGVATTRPTIAPAGDEILRSAGWIDATPTPTIAQLDQAPVQQEAGTESLLNKGQQFTTEPRGDIAPPDAAPEGPAAQQEQAMGQPVADGGADAGDNRPDVANPLASMHPQSGAPHPQTGMIGRRAGIETAAIERAQS